VEETFSHKMDDLKNLLRDVDKAETSSPQIPLLEMEFSFSGGIELFPSVWKAAEGATSPNENTRRIAIDVLVNMVAPRYSPLIAYLLVTRLTDPDRKIRAKVIASLGDVLTPDENGLPAPDVVREHLYSFLRNLEKNQILSILQTIEEYPGLTNQATRLFRCCSTAGDTLIELLSDRTLPITARQWAVYFIGQVGYLGARGELERLLGRLESKANGQRSMSFVPEQSTDEVMLIPDIRQTLQLLAS
jgi:hypothetical protein